MMARLLLSLALSGLLRDALRALAGLILALMMALAFAVSSLAAVLSPAFPGRALASAQVAEVPADQVAAMQEAAATCGLPWQVLAAIGKVESDFGRNMATSSAGAIGYGQFLPASWDAYGNGGDPYDYRDALPAMARYRCDHGGPQDLRRALFAYNHADWYVDQVLAVAVRYGYLAPGSLGARVVDLARAQAGVPYRWGGTDPGAGFDCSGLVQWVFAQAGVTLPRTAHQQFTATVRLAPGDLAPGDLVFFARTYAGAPDFITHVGIWVGDGQMVTAPQEGEPVQEVPAFTGYWGAHFAGAGRVAAGR